MLCCDEKLLKDRGAVIEGGTLAETMKRAQAFRGQLDGIRDELLRRLKRIFGHE